MAGRGPGMLLIAGAIEADALAMPLSYTATQVASKSAGGTVDYGAVRRPVAPAGYACLCGVVGRGASPPPLAAIRCVKLEHLVPGRGEPIAAGDATKWHVSRIVPQHQSTRSEEGVGIDTGVFKVSEPVLQANGSMRSKMPPRRTLPSAASPLRGAPHSVRAPRPRSPRVQAEGRVRIARCDPDSRCCASPDAGTCS